MSQTIPIRVVGIDPNNSCHLLLNDNGNSGSNVFVDPGDYVLWSIKPNEGVASFQNIFKDTGSDQLFSEPPAPFGNAGNWRGRINPDAKKNDFEDYTINWYAPGQTGNDYCSYDPKITINP